MLWNENKSSLVYSRNSGLKMGIFSEEDKIIKKSEIIPHSSFKAF
jgi:hypothetical protein